MDLSISVADDIFHRLADHKFFLNGELKYFVREFEEKRNDREDVQLENTKLNFEALIKKDIDVVEQRLKENNFDIILTKCKFGYLVSFILITYLVFSTYSKYLKRIILNFVKH